MSEVEVSVAEMDKLVDAMFALRLEIDEQEAKTTELNKKLSAMQMEATEKMKELGRKSYASSKGTLSIKETWRFPLPQALEDKEAMFSYFKEKGGKELLYRLATVNSNSYSAFCKEEWETAKNEGRGMEYKGPGGSEARLFETVAMIKKR